MKRLLATLFIMFALCGCPKSTPVTPPAPPPVGSVDHSITFTFNQTFADNPACTASIITSCINGFDEGYISGTSTQNMLHSDSSAICTGSAQPEPCMTTFNGTVPLGPVVFYVITTGVNASGVAIVSTATMSSAVTVSVDPAAAVVVTVN